jgi:hypothetical protein
MDSNPNCSKCGVPINVFLYRDELLHGGYCSVCQTALCDVCTKWSKYDLSPSTLIEYVKKSKEFVLPRRIRIQGYAAPRALCSECSKTHTVDELIKEKATK